jgi:hypothetical protein
MTQHWLGNLSKLRQKQQKKSPAQPEEETTLNERTTKAKAQVQQRINSATTTTNMIRVNLPWGDPIERKDLDSTRLCFQNVNGIKSWDKCIDASEIGFHANVNQVDVLGLAETNLDWQSYRVYNQCRQHLASFWQQHVFQVASSNITFDSTYQPGGVAMLTGNKWASRVSEKHTDALGRWVYNTMQGRANLLPRTNRARLKGRRRLINNSGVY